MHKTTSLLTCHPVHFGCIWSRVCFLRSVWRICVDVDGMWCERGGRNRNATVSVFMAIACIHRSSSLQSAQDRARWRELCTKLARTIFQGWVTGQLAVTTYAGLVRGTFAQFLHSCKRIRIPGPARVPRSGHRGVAARTGPDWRMCASIRT